MGRTAHRWPSPADNADALYLGDLEVDFAYLGNLESFTAITALGFWRASDEVAGAIPNKGTAGAVLDATNTGLVPVDQAVWFPGTAGNSLDTGHYPALNIVGDIDIIARVRSDAFQVANSIIAVWGSTGQRSYYIRQEADGRLFFGNTSDGSTEDQVPSTAIPWGVGDTRWIRIFRSGTLVTFQYALDQDSVPSTWLPISTGSIVNAGDMFVGDAPVTIGCRRLSDTELPWTGNILYVAIIDGIDGTPVFTFDAATDLPPGPGAVEFPCTTGQVITVNRGTTGPVTVLAPKPVLVNPDGGDAGIQTPSTTAFDVAADEDLLYAWVGHHDNRSMLANSNIAGRRKDSGDPGAYMSYLTDGRLKGSFLDDAATTIGTNNIPTVTADTVLLDPVVHFLRLNRATNLVDYLVYGVAGFLFTSGTTDASTLLAMTVGAANDQRFHQKTVGAFSSASWNKGVGIAPTDEELADMAARLLRAATGPTRRTTGKYPPLNPFQGDTWTASNGDIGVYLGGSWTAKSPVTNNITELLGNSDLWIASDTP